MQKELLRRGMEFRKMIFKKKAVFVDLDGTLVDSLGALKNVYFALLKGFGIQGTEEEFQVLNGLTLPQIVSLLKEKYQLNSTLKEIETLYVQSIETAYKREVFPYPEAIGLLEDLKKKGAVLCLVTATNASLVTIFLRKYALDKIFDGVITPKVGEPGKPDPALYLRALKTFDLDPEEAIVIEDSRNGVHAALAAGIATLWIFQTERNQDCRVHSASDWKSVKNYLEPLFEDEVYE